MNCRMKKAFTLVEVMVAVGLLALILSFAGLVFNASIDTYRTAAANAEIMRKFRAITDRLDADFEGLRKDGEILVVWDANNIRPDFTDCDHDGFERFDRIMFFADGDFQSYGSPMVRGNLARVSYMLASKGVPPNIARARELGRSDRVLARTQHIVTSSADPGVDWFFEPAVFGDPNWHDWHNFREYDKVDAIGELPLPPRNYESLSLGEWKHFPWRLKQDMLEVVADLDIDPATTRVDRNYRGAFADPQVPGTIHMLLCEGVGEFKIQGWYDRENRWAPEVDPNGDGDVTDSDLFLAPADPCVAHLLYPYRRDLNGYDYGHLRMRIPSYAQADVNEANFNDIPGLGKALKFTFTLFDSKGIIEKGRTFTHIVYLD